MRIDDTMDKNGLTDKIYENILIWLENIYDIDRGSIEHYERPEGILVGHLKVVICASIVEIISNCEWESCVIESDMAKNIKKAFYIEFGLQKGRTI